MDQVRRLLPEASWTSRLYGPARGGGSTSPEKLSRELEKSPEVLGKKQLPVILSGRSLIQVCFNGKPRTCWVESEHRCWK